MSPASTTMACFEIASPSNSRKELREKVTAYLEAGATVAGIGGSVQSCVQKRFWVASAGWSWYEVD
jgi:hypothetical protein